LVAVTVRPAIDAAGYQFAGDPNPNLKANARELAALFD
jgi:hypothetical protein